MANWRDRVQKMVGRKRFVVLRLMVHLQGEEIAPLLGTFNRVSRKAIAAEGDLQILGAGLVELCETLLRYDLYWRAAANEGDVFWDEREAGDYFNDLFTDSAQRYLSGLGDEDSADDELLSLPVTRNVILMLGAAYTGEMPSLETDLAAIDPLGDGLKDLIALHQQGERLRGVQIHFAPARLGDLLADDQVLENYPELIPL